MRHALRAAFGDGTRRTVELQKVLSGKPLSERLRNKGLSVVPEHIRPYVNLETN